MTQSKMDIEEVLVSYQAEVIYKSIFYCRGNACSGVVVRSLEQWLQKIWMHSLCTIKDGKVAILLPVYI